MRFSPKARRKSRRNRTMNNACERRRRQTKARLALETLEDRLTPSTVASFADNADNMAVDADGNVYASGRFRGWVDFDNGPGQTWVEGYRTDAYFADGAGFLAKYSPAGDLQWARKTTDHTAGRGELAVYSDAGSTFVYDSAYDADAGEFIVRKYDSGGTLVWEQEAPFHDTGSRFVIFAADDPGSLYFAGDFTGTRDFDGDPATTADQRTADGRDVFVVKWDAAGEFQWVQQLGGSGDQERDTEETGVAVSGATVYVAGQFDGSMLGLTAGGDAAVKDGYLVRLDAGDGSVLSADGYVDRDWDAIALDGSSVHLVGGGYTHPEGSYLARIPGAGGPTDWVQPIYTPSGAWNNVLDVSADGGVYVAGSFNSTYDFDPSPGSSWTMSPQGSSDVFVQKFSAADGSLVWARQMGGTAWFSNVDEHADEVVALGDGVLTAGFFVSRDADFDPGAGQALLNADGDRDGFISRLSSDGTFDADSWVVEIGDQTRTQDDGDAGYLEVGNWKDYNGGGYQNDARSNRKGNGSDTASWTFQGLTPGQSYDVRATWVGSNRNASNAVYEVNGVAAPPVNQRLTPDDFQNDQNAYGISTRWAQLGTFTADAAGALAVVLSDMANGEVIADGIRIVAAGPPAPGITVTPTSGLVTTEAGGTASFDVVLDTAPTEEVMIAVSSSDTSEGTVSTSMLTFDSGNWNVAQTVTVTGVDDADADGNVAYTIITGPAVSADPGYSGLDAANVSVTNTDDDGAAIGVTSVSPDTASPGQQLPVSVFGTGFVSGATVDFGQRVTVQNVTFFDDTRLDVMIKVHPRADAGPRDVTVTNPDGSSATCTACFTVSAGLLAERTADGNSVANGLSQADAQKLADAAIERWQTAAVAPFQILVADLPGRLLGTAAGATITLDSDAAGWGWFVDTTPLNDSEFTTPGDQGEQDRIDALSVIAHELGHLLGFEHEDQGVMQETLATGERSLLEVGQADAFAPVLEPIGGPALSAPPFDAYFAAISAEVANRLKDA